MIFFIPAKSRCRSSLVTLVLCIFVLICSMEFHAVSAEEVVSVVIPEVESEVPETPPEAAIEIEAEIDAVPEVETGKEEVAEVDDAETEETEEESAEEIAEESVEGVEEIVDEEEDDDIPAAVICNEEEDDESPETISNIIQTVKEKTTGVLDRIKNLSQKDAKKAAAATIGVWGAATGIGWAMQRGGEN